MPGKELAASIGWLIIKKALADPDFQKWAEGTVSKFKRELLSDVASLLPIFGASLLKGVFERAPQLQAIPGTIGEIATQAVEALEHDPDLPGFSNIIDLSEIATKILGRLGL